MNQAENNTPAKAPAETLNERVRSLRLTDAEDNGAGASSWWSWLPWVLCGVLVCATAVCALEAFSPIDDDTLKKLAEGRGLNVGKGHANASGLANLAIPGTSDSAATEIALEAKGYIVPIRLIQVSPKVGGTVMKLNVEENMEVKKGFVLAELEDIEFKSDFERARAQRDELKDYRKDEELQAKAELDDAIAQREQMAAKYKRYVVLKARGASAPEDYEGAESWYKSMESRVARLELAYKLLVNGPRDAKIAAAEADFRKAKWRYKNTMVEAPITGVILSKKTEEGNIVNPSAFSNGLSASLCEMADLYKMEVDLSVAERDIAKVFKDQDCRIRAEAFPNRIYTGHVSRIMPMGDRGKSAVPVRVIIDFPARDVKGQPLPLEKQGEYLRPEMGAIVTFLNRKLTPK